jgi:hypothetical protein
MAEERKLVFLTQPTNTVKGTPLSPVRVAVCGENGKIDESFCGEITIALDRSAILSTELAGQPDQSLACRFRASGAGFTDAVSNVFFILEPHQMTFSDLPVPERQPPPMVYHYTDRIGLIGIVQKQSVWATHIRYLNDSSEYSYTAKLALDLAESMTRQIDTTLLRGPFEDFRNHLARLELNTHYFVFSLSADGGDRLSQWRSYGKPGDAYSLGFESQGLQELARSNSGWFIECIYDPGQQQPLLRRFLADYVERLRLATSFVTPQHAIKQITAEALGSLDLLATYFKDRTFVEENEWRLVVPFNEHKTVVRYRPGRSLVTPYVELPITLPNGSVPLSQVSTGPAPHPGLDVAAVQRMCSDSGILLKACTGSGVPYRAW